MAWKAIRKINANNQIGGHDMQITELDCLLAGFAGGFISSACFLIAVTGHIRYLFDRKIKDLQMQLIAIRAEINSQYETGDF